jgi:hypothetical protein
LPAFRPASAAAGGCRSSGVSITAPRAAPHGAPEGYSEFIRVKPRCHLLRPHPQNRPLSTACDKPWHASSPRPNIGERSAPVSLSLTRRTPNSAFGDWDRSALLNPSPRRLGNRSCGRPQAADRTPCNPAPPGARRPRLRAAGAPTRRRRSARSLGRVTASYRALAPRECRDSSSTLSMRRKVPVRRFRATRPQGSPLPCNSRCDLSGSSLVISDHIICMNGQELWQAMEQKLDLKTRRAPRRTGRAFVELRIPYSI